MNLLQALVPRIPKRFLLFVAAMVWTFAGGMLLFRGLMLFRGSEHYWLRLIISITGGFLFYRFLFSRISKKHTTRIRGLSHERPCLFSFFNIKSYILMSIMITAGITLRKSGIIPQDYLSVLYVTMGIPLFISAFRFYFAGAVYRDPELLHEGSEQNA